MKNVILAILIAMAASTSFASGEVKPTQGKVVTQTEEHKETVTTEHEAPTEAK